MIAGGQHAAVRSFGGVDILCNYASALRNGPLVEPSGDLRLMPAQ
jgi:hypothetical protein